MHIDFDKYSNVKSIINSWDERYKIASLFILCLSISFVKQLPLLIIIFSFSIVLIILTKIPLKFFIKALKLPSFFFIIMIIALPLTSGGDDFYFIYNVKVFKKGIQLAYQILLRGYSIIIIILVIFSSSRFDISMRALHRLKIPGILVDMILYIYRYIFLYKNRLKQMKLSLKCRGYKSRFSIRGFKVISALVANLFIKSFEQTEKVHSAMVLRGYEGEHQQIYDFNAAYKDIVKSIIIFLVSCLLVVLEVLL